MTDWTKEDDTLKLARVSQILGWSRTTIYRRLARKEMVPAPISYGDGEYRWRAADVQAFLAARDYSRPAKRPPLLTVPPAVRVASAADVKATAASLLKGA